MKSLFKNEGPFDINFLIKNTLYTKKKKIKKHIIKNVSSLLYAKKNEITFFSSLKYKDQLNSTNASFCLIDEKFANLNNNHKLNLIISSNPLYDFILISRIFFPDSIFDNYNFKQNNKFINLRKKNNTLIDKSVKIGSKFSVGLNTVIKKNVIIGKNVKIGSNCVISNSIIGNNVIISDGTVIGKIGFGFKHFDNKINFIPHFGCVIIKDNVYLGSNCTVDRGSFSNTEIGEGSMIDNQVHIAHNVIIGSNCFIAGQVGIAGSTKIGRNCLIGGKAGISGHLKIGDNVKIGGQSGILRNVDSGEKLIGYPATSIKTFLKKI